MPAQLILMNPSRPGAARRAARAESKVGKAVARALAKSRAKHARQMERRMEIAGKWNASGKHQKAPLTPRRVENLIREAVLEEQHRARVAASKKNRQAAKKASKAAGSPRTNPKEKTMARKKRSNPRKSHRVSRRSNPKGVPLTAAQKAKAAATRAAKSANMASMLQGLARSGALTAEQYAALSGIRIRKARGPGKSRVKMTEAERAARRASRKSATKSYRSGAKSAVRGLVAALKQGRISRSEFSTALGRYKKPARRGAARLVRAVRRGKITAATADLFGPRHVRAFGWAKQAPRKSAGRKLALGYLQIKKTMSMHKDPLSRQIARELGLTSIPNGGGIKGFIKNLKVSLPLAAFAAGGVVLAGIGVSKIISMPAVQAWMAKPSIGKWVVPAVAVGLGLGASHLMKSSKSLAKYSGAAIAGGAAIAALAIINQKGTDGLSFANKQVPLLAMGDYHMGDYHMGLTVGDYHMGAIEEVNARRQLAPAGQPMPRHDTRRDGVDQSISQFSGTLAGDIFDQN